jgi:hypothetical protein
MMTKTWSELGKLAGVVVEVPPFEPPAELPDDPSVTGVELALPPVLPV